MTSRATEASSNGRTADFGSAHEGSNPSASASCPPRAANAGPELKASGRPGRVLLVGLGAVPARLLAEAGAALREQLAVAPQVGPSLDRPSYAFNEPRRQYHAPAILRRLAGLRGGAGGAPVVGLADVDLFEPDAPFVLGDADRTAGAAVLSTRRLAGPEPEVLTRRVRAEAVNAAGQLLGLSPCHDYRCAMFASADAVDADRKGPGLCGACRTALGL